jgi:EAL domain-containing protein (putative c-di-GMP-specific phosphodiesterase class I)
LELPLLPEISCRDDVTAIAFAIINAITTLGAGLNLQIIAEGVESEQLKNLLKTLHCNYIYARILF